MKWLRQTKDYHPHLDGNLFDWILKQCEEIRKRLPQPPIAAQAAARRVRRI